MAFWIIVVLVRLWHWWLRYVFGFKSTHRTPRSVIPPPVVSHPIRSQPKPPWVARELIRLKAWSPELGCRVIAEVFNRQFADRRVTVGKTYVATVLRRSRADVIRLRRTLKHRVPRPIPINQTWALDLTGRADLTGRQHLILGLLDHGSRACLRLSALSDKRSMTILRELISVFRQFGIPRRIRVDNEACFNSRLLKAALGLLNVRLQTIQLHCPWQNGRIERFFGTFKRALKQIVLRDRADLATKLIEFRAWYNHARPHQHLHGQTSAEVWAGRRKSTKAPLLFSGWDDQLIGWYFPP